MVRVEPRSVLATTQAADPVVEVVEGDGEVAGVAAGRLEAEPGGAEHADPHEGEDLERTRGGCWASSSTVIPRAAKTEIP